MTNANDANKANDSIITSLLVGVGLILTVVVAILLGLSDREQVRMPSAIAAASANQLAASTPVLPTAQLPTPAPSATATSSPAPSPTVSSIVVTAAAPAAVDVLAEVPCGNIPDGWLPYVIQNGDNLLRLSASSGSTPSEIAQANCLELEYLLPGSQIFLPPAPPTRPPCGPPIWWARYVVSRGDTLYSLARRHGTTVYAIMQANCLETTRIYAGRSLFLPPISIQPVITPTPTSTLTPSATPSPTSAPSATPQPTVTPPIATTPTPTSTPPTPATGTATSSPTPTPPTTASQTPTVTASPTMSTPSETPTPTQTTVPSPTPTPRPSNTPTATQTPVPTSTSIPTATPTGTPIVAPTEPATSTPSTKPTTGVSPGT